MKHKKSNGTLSDDIRNEWNRSVKHDKTRKRTMDTMSMEYYLQICGTIAHKVWNVTQFRLETRQIAS